MPYVREARSLLQETLLISAALAALAVAACATGVGVALVGNRTPVTIYEAR